MGRCINFSYLIAPFMPRIGGTHKHDVKSEIDWMNSLGYKSEVRKDGKFVREDNDIIVERIFECSFMMCTPMAVDDLYISRLFQCLVC